MPLKILCKKCTVRFFTQPLEHSLQNRFLTLYIAESKSKETKFYLVWFPSEFMYSVVEGISIDEINPKPTDKVHVKDSNGTPEGIVYTCGMFHSGRNFRSFYMFHLIANL